MLSRNLLIASVVVFLTTAALTAPVEEKEQEETEVETEEVEEELSEEEEDDDDSKSQDKNMGAASQATTASKGLGLSALPDTSAQGQAPHGNKQNGDTGPSLSAGSESSSSTSTSQGGIGGEGGLHAASSLSHESVGVPGHPASSPGTGSAGTGGDSADTLLTHVSEHHQGWPQLDTNGPDAPEIESNGNGQKLLNGGFENGHTAVGTDPFTDGTTHSDSAAGVLEPFGTGSHLDYTGMIDESSHDFLIGLMGGVDPFSPDIHIDTDHIGLFPHLDSTAVGLGPEGDLTQMSSSSPYPDAPPEYHPDFNGQSVPDHSPHSPGFVNDHHVSGLDGASHSEGHISMGDNAGHFDATDGVAGISHIDHPHIDYPEGGVDVSSTDSPDTNGNGRQSLVIDTNGGDHHVDEHHDITGTIPATVEQLGQASVSHTDTAAVTDVSVDDAHTSGPLIDVAVVGDVHSSSAPETAGPDDVAVTSGLMNFTEPDLGLGHDVTGAADSLSVVDPTESSVTGDPSGVSSQTDATGTDMNTDMATDKVTGDPQATPQASSQPATEHSQLAVPAAEQYNTSGQGPEGAENVELEDTC